MPSKQLSKPKPKPIPTPFMAINISAKPDTVAQGGSTTISVTVSRMDTHGLAPVPGAHVQLDAGGGSFCISAGSLGLTDSAGIFTAIWQAPRNTPYGEFEIDATVTKSGYPDGNRFIRVSIEPPPQLQVQMTATPNPVAQGQSTSIGVTVTAEGAPVPGALVRLHTDGGSFCTPTADLPGSTDYSGFLMATWQRPSQLYVGWDSYTIGAYVSHSGYRDGYGYVQVKLGPLPQLTVDISANPNSIEPEGSSTITVTVTSDGIPEPCAHVTLQGPVSVYSFDLGLFAESRKAIVAGWTDYSGIFTGIWRNTGFVPSEMIPTITFNAEATKPRYADSGKVYLQLDYQYSIGMWMCTEAAGDIHPGDWVYIIVEVDAGSLDSLHSLGAAGVLVDFSTDAGEFLGEGKLTTEYTGEDGTSYVTWVPDSPGSYPVYAQIQVANTQGTIIYKEKQFIIIDVLEKKSPQYPFEKGRNQPEK